MTEEVVGSVLAMAVVAMSVDVTGAADLKIWATAATDVTAEVAGEEKGTVEVYVMPWDKAGVTVLLRGVPAAAPAAVPCCRVVTVGLMLCAEARTFLYSLLQASHLATCLLLRSPLSSSCW